MSQYPYTLPSGPQQPYAYGYGDPRQILLAPAKRAGLLMIILGCLGLACGACMGIMAPLLSNEEVWRQMPPEQLSAIRAQEAAWGMPIAQVFVLMAAQLGVPGLPLLICGILARKGTLGRVNAALVVVIFCAMAYVALLVYDMLRLTRQGMAGQQPAGNVCLYVVALALAGLCIFWLIQARRNAPQVSLVDQYQASYWQYAQQQQLYNQWAYARQQQQPPQQAPPPAQQPPLPPPPANP